MTIELIKTKKETVLNFVVEAQDNSPKVSEIVEWLTSHHIKTVFAENKQAIFSTPLMAEMYFWHQKITDLGIHFDYSRLSDNEKHILDLTLKNINIPPVRKREHKDFLIILGEKGYGVFKTVCSALQFTGQAFVSLFRFMTGKAIYRSKDFWFTFGDCSYKAIGITALVSFLVGLILAFVGALQLQAFGAGIYVASMVSLGMTRIMAAIMVGIIMAGRTGSSYAATLGTMQVNEEIDALKTLGIKITDYLVAPRVVSIVLTIPFLTLFADVLGILGGATVGITFLGISPSSYFDYSIKALTLRNILVGLLHSFVYGFIISLCGCYEGLTAGRDADAVGKATTKSVVTALVWMIVATGILTILLEAIGL